MYQVGLAAEKPINWGDDMWTLHSDAKEAKDVFDAKIARIKTDLEADDVRIVLSCPTPEGFRRTLCPTYKSNRKDVRKPVVHQALREHAIEAYGAILRPRLEADDIIGIMATEPTDERRIVVSVDKDFRTVPCLFYRTSEDSPKVETVTADDAARFHAVQALTGDRVDGYVGVPGCGPATAEKILKGVPTEKLWDAVVAAYDKAGLSEEVALTTARLARILQHGDYNKETGVIRLWKPRK